MQARFGFGPGVRQLIRVYRPLFLEVVRSMNRLIRAAQAAAAASEDLRRITQQNYTLTPRASRPTHLKGHDLDLEP